MPPFHAPSTRTIMPSSGYSGSFARDSHREHERGHRHREGDRDRHDRDGGSGRKRARERSRERIDTHPRDNGSVRSCLSPRRRSNGSEGDGRGRPATHVSRVSSSPLPSRGGAHAKRSPSRPPRNEQPPSLPPDTHLAFCISSCAFIVEMGKALHLGKVATHTALVFFHRFFKHQSFRSHDRLLVAAACIYLAAKVEERNNVKLSLIVVAYLKRLGVLPPEVDAQEYNRNAVAREEVPTWKSRVITYERCLLYTMAFDLTVVHPFKALQDLMKTVRDVMAEEGKKTGLSGGPGNALASLPFPSASSSPAVSALDHRTVFAQACKFLNDSFFLPALIEVDATYSAALALYLTLVLYDIKPPAGKGSWLEVWHIQDEPRFLKDCLLAVKTYGEESGKRLNLEPVPDPAAVEVPPAEDALGRDMATLYGGSKGGGMPGGLLRNLTPLV